MWTYRVVKKHYPHPYREEFILGIHEVYYDAEGRIFAISEEQIEPHGETLEELKEDLAWMTKALEKPILDFETAVDPEAAAAMLDYKEEDLISWDDLDKELKKETEG